MKRWYAWLITALLAITLISCSSPEPAAAPKETAAPASSTVKPTEEPAKPAETPAPAETKAPETTPADAAKTEPAPATTPADDKAAAPAAGGAAAPADSGSKPAAPAAEPKPAPAEQKPAPAAKPEPKPAETAAPAPAPAPAADAPKITVSAAGKKVLFVGRERNPAEDVAVADRLKKLGFSVTNIEDRDVNIDEVKGYDLIYISQTTNSKYLRDGFMKEVAIPTVYVKNHGMFYLGLSSVEENTTAMNSKTIEITDSKHPVAAGLSGKVDVFKEAGDKFGVSYGVPGKEAKIIATVPGDKKKAALYYYDKGAKADNGYTVKARASFYYWSNGMHENSTDASWKLLDNLVLWTLQNG